MSQTLTVEVADFVIRSKVEPLGVALLDPSRLAGIVTAVVDAGKGLGLATNQLRVEGSAPVLVDRVIEAYFPEQQILARVGPQQIDVHSSKANRASRVSAVVFFDQLVRSLSGTLGTGNAAVSTWSMHVREAIRLAPPAAPPLGEVVSTGIAFNYGAAAWDPTILATTLVVEPSTVVADGTFLSLTNVWARSEVLLVSRMEALWSYWQKQMNVSLQGVWS